MKALLVFIKRNIFVYCKNKENIFYSSLSMLIIIMLMLVFLADMNTSQVKQTLRDMDQKTQEMQIPEKMLVEGTRDPALDDTNARNLVLSSIIAGITIVNGISVAMVAIGIMINDEACGQLSSFYVAPVSRAFLVTGYVMATFVLSVIFSIATVLISELILVWSGGTALSVIQNLKILGLILVNSFSVTCLMFFLSNFARSETAYSGLSTLIGTLSGFVAGIYLPIGMLPKAVGEVLVYIPLCQGSAWMKELFTKDAIRKTFAGLPKQAVDVYRDYMGINLKIGDTVITNPVKFIILIGSGLVFLILSTIILNKKNVRDR